MQYVCLYPAYSFQFFHSELSLKLNSWTYNFIAVSGHNLESSQTWGFLMDFLQHRQGGMVSYQVFLLSPLQGPNSWKHWSLNTVVFSSCFWKEMSLVIDWFREIKKRTFINKQISESSIWHPYPNIQIWTLHFLHKYGKTFCLNL